MKKHIFINLIIVSLGFLSAPVFAEYYNCGKFTDSYETIRCNSRNLIESDKELNQVYVDLIKFIKPDIKIKLKNTERKWIAYRELSCTKDCSLSVECHYWANRDRIKYLYERLNECKASTCRNDLIISLSHSKTFISND
jgi:uncharacterized protein YecT (DUF1311 family)